MIGNGFFLINGKGFRMSISLCASWKCLAKMVQFPGTSSRGRNGLVCGVASSKPCLEADAGVRMLSLAIHQVMIRRWYQCAQLWYVKVMGFKDDLDDLVLVWSCIYVLVEIPRISYVTTSSKYELMQFSHLSIVEFQSKPFFCTKILTVCLFPAIREFCNVKAARAEWPFRCLELNMKFYLFFPWPRKATSRISQRVSGPLLLSSSVDLLLAMTRSASLMVRDICRYCSIENVDWCGL